MKKRFIRSVAIVGLVVTAAPGVGAAEIAPHRALYSMSLGSAKSDSGVVDARGTMAYEWGETCDGWTIEQRYRLKMRDRKSTRLNSSHRSLSRMPSSA